MAVPQRRCITKTATKSAIIVMMVMMAARAVHVEPVTA